MQLMFEGLWWNNLCRKVQNNILKLICITLNDLKYYLKGISCSVKILKT